MKTPVENSANLFEPFYEVVANPLEYARSWKAQTGRKVCGYFCSYAPEELIWAAGALPFRIFGSSTNLSLADTHLQAYSCSLVRGALEDALSGKLSFLDGTIFPHTCDSIQRLSDIWRMNGGFAFHADLVLPVKLNTESAREYMVAVVKKLKRDMEQGLKVSISSQNLVDAVSLHNGIRAQLLKLYETRQKNPEIISGSDMHALVKASMMMDRSELNQRLSDLNDAFERRAEPPQKSKKRLVLSGGLCNMPDIYRVIEAAGGVVVWDDLCTGGRYFEGQVPIQGDMLAAIANRYAERVVCPAKHAGLRSRGDHLIRLVKANAAAGVIFAMLKFCDPHAFDYPYLREMLTAEGIPNTLFEIEDQQPAEGQFRTRCEAFLEML